MNHSGKLLLLHDARLGLAPGREDIDHALVEIGSGQFDGVARQNSKIETIEPAGAWIVPRPVGRNVVVPNAISARCGKGPVGGLKHSQRA